MNHNKQDNLHDKWYRGHPLVWLMSPFALLFYVLSAFRRLLFRLGIKKAYKAGVPVIVVGNISVGGNGKTPVVLALAEYYKKRGIRVGILSRGYGGTSSVYPRLVSADDSPLEVGDEPCLLAKRSLCHVVVDPIRSRGAACLEHDHQCQLIICDDGLQHYALSRDVELVVMDSRLVGSGFLLPMGPLREGMWRLSGVDAIVHNSDRMPTFRRPVAPQFIMSLSAHQFVSVTANTTASIEDFRHTPCHALAGIGSPKRFFGHLSAMGITLKSQHALPDHHSFSVQDIPRGRVLMTEKDAVKAVSFAHDDCWYLPVSAKISPDFYNLINAKLLSAGFALQENTED